MPEGLTQVTFSRPGKEGRPRMTQYGGEFPGGLRSISPRLEGGFMEMMGSEDRSHCSKQGI